MISEAQVIERLVKDEGEVLHCYLDSLGYATIGVGILIDERKGGGITREESRYLLRNRIARKTAECENRFEWWNAIDDVRQGVILCMAFQLGVNGVANFRRMCAALRIRDYITASTEMKDSGWHKQTPSRCERMAEIMRSGQWQ